MVMRVQTINGPVDLTAEQIRPGMVFRDAAGYAFTCGEPLATGGWKDAHSPSTRVALWAYNLLGCDPTVATRADCATFGIHGDAAAHGFARVKGGGAVDLRERIPTGAVLECDGDRSKPIAVDPCDLRLSADGKKFLSLRSRFVGLSAAHAAPKDIARLCCNHVPMRDDGHPEIVPDVDGLFRAKRCTLAIGDHAEHEDIAAGVRWKAKETGQPCPNTLAAAIRDRIRMFGYGCEVVSTSPPLVNMLGAHYPNVSGFIAETVSWLRETDRYAHPVVIAHDCPTCGCKGQCSWREQGEADPDAVVCETCQCRWCGPATPQWRARQRKEASPQERAHAAVYGTVADMERTGVVRKRGCPECPAAEGERCAEDCPRVLRHWASRCGAKPQKGQKLTTRHSYQVATGGERCVNGQACAGEHRLNADYQSPRWTDTPEFVDCAMCTARIFDVQPVMYSAHDETGVRRDGPVCKGCVRHIHEGVRWERGRLVPNAAVPAASGPVVAGSRQPPKLAGFQASPAIGGAS